MTTIVLSAHPATGVPPLPTGRKVLLAFQVRGGGDPVLEAAHELAVLHLARADTGHVLDDAMADDTSTATAARTQRHLDSAIGRQVARIDDHVMSAVHVHRGGALHTETVGALIARLALAWQYSQQLAVLPVADGRAQSAWFALAELVDAYDDLIRDVHAGRRCLPRRRTADPDRRE